VADIMETVRDIVEMVAETAMVAAEGDNNF